ncbi:unnamed protein product, partial [Prorocentrum cordatum]
IGRLGPRPRGGGVGRAAAYEPGEVPTKSYRALTKIGVRIGPDWTTPGSRAPRIRGRWRRSGAGSGPPPSRRSRCSRWWTNVLRGRRACPADIS